MVAPDDLLAIAEPKQGLNVLFILGSYLAESPMFLNAFNAGAGFGFLREAGTSCGKPAIEAELRYLEDIDCSDVRVEESGQHIILEGTVPTSRELSKIVRLAVEIAGRDNVICQLIVVPRDKSEVSFMLG